MSEINSECCPEFHPEEWENKRFTWEYKKFVRGLVRSFFYMPLNFGSVMKRLLRGISPEEKINLVLSRDISKWQSELLVAVEYPSRTDSNIVKSGEFISKVYEGPYSSTGKFYKEFDKYLKSQEITCKQIYSWYVYCPKCIKKYGKNYVVLIGQIK